MECRRMLSRTGMLEVFQQEVLHQQNQRLALELDTGFFQTGQRPTLLLP